MTKLTKPLSTSDLNRALRAVEIDVRDLLQEPIETWNTLLVDDEIPIVNRLWRPWTWASPAHGGEVEFRLFLHEISPNPTGVESLWHKHRWPSIIRSYRLTDKQGLKGVYLHRRGWTPDPYEGTASTVLNGEVYAMTDPEEYHSVKIVTAPVHSLMLAGPLYDSVGTATAERSKRAELGPVSPSTANKMVAIFRDLYPPFSGMLAEKFS